MKCPQCKSENVDGKTFCSDCGSLLTPQLLPVIRAQVEEYMGRHFKEQKVVDVETTEAITERFLKWVKWFLVPATFLLAVLGFTLALLGLHDYSDVHKAAQQAVNESNAATKSATDAATKGVEAETKVAEAIKAIDEATSKMKAQANSADRLSSTVSGLESKTAEQIANASRHVEGRITELDKKVEAANQAIQQQQAKLTSTNELVTAMFTKGRTELFSTVNDAPKCVTIPNGVAGKGWKSVYAALRSTDLSNCADSVARICAAEIFVLLIR